MAQNFYQTEHIPKNKHSLTYVFEGSHFEVPTFNLTATGPDLNTNKTKNKVSSRKKIFQV